jgi:hypothetical protein
MAELGRQIVADAKGQRGYFTRQQATAGGVTRSMLRSRVQSGNLQRVGARTFTGTYVEPSAMADLHGLMLDIGGLVWACGPTAAAVHGFDSYVLKPPFHLLVLHNRRVERKGHVIHSTRDLPLIDRAIVHGVAATTATRTIVDLAGWDSADRVTTALDSALRDGTTSEEFLHRRITALRTRGRVGFGQLIAVIEGSEASRGGHSWLERRFLELIAATGLPRPETQVCLSRTGQRVIRVDCLFRQPRVVVELLGYRWHRSKEQMQRDAERMNRLQLDGWKVIQFTYDQVSLQPESIPSVIAGALSCSGEESG